ncbi:DUF2281 domain-containing protein [Chamaesiphon sp.]|uniref:DUF2281 domain-containing protein n=1 Tax=Chamaesiphon sp. TaxID=2814140 RepID=UPI0035933C78
MSTLLEQILADITRLDPAEQLEVVASVIARLQQQPDPSPTNKLSRQDLFGCLRGKVRMAADFDDPLSDFAEYM